MSRFHLALLASILAVTAPARCATLGTGPEGITIDAGSMGQFTLQYPELMNEAKQTPHKLVGKFPAGKTAALQYDGGAQIAVATADTGDFTLELSNVQGDVKWLRMTMLISLGFSQGGRWKIADTEKPFPKEKPAAPKLFQGHATTFQLTDNQGKSLAITTPPFAFQELTDNREWNWGIFEWRFLVPFERNAPTYKLKVVSGGTDGGQTVAIVDQFGQSKLEDWPGKLRSLEELKADVESEKAYYAALQPPPRDKYGGLPGSREKLGLKASGSFHVEQTNGRWILVDPEGNAFFHLGICSFGPSEDYTFVKGREQLYEWLPPREGEFKTAFHPDDYWTQDTFSFHLANVIRKYGKPYSPEDYAARTIERARKWGFNSIGAFSPLPQAAQTASFPYVATLPLDQWSGGIPRLPGVNETWDPFDEKIRERVEQNFSKSVAARAGDPLLIGYFLVNEPLYEDIPKVVPTLDSDYACKRRLVRMLGEKYQTIAAFNAAWQDRAKSFDELNDANLVVKTKAASEDMGEFTGLFFETYFQFVADTFHKYDKNHMLIGNRLQPGTINNEQLCRIMGKYLDVISFNYYTYALDKDFLTRLHKWSGGKPMMLSEFFWSAPGESGLVGGRDVSSQQERGLAYRNYVEQASSLGFIVGIEWFTLGDQAATGRWFEKLSGERANTGLVSVADRPWKPMLAEMMKTNYDIYSVWLGEKAPFIFDDPRFNPAGGGTKTASVPRATGPIRLDGATGNWPGIPPEQISGKRLVQGGSAGGVEATFKLCWDDANLYVLVNVSDPTPMKNEQSGNMLWSGDGVELFIGAEKLDEGGPLLFTDRQILLGAGRKEGRYFYANAPQQYPCEMIVVPGVDAKSYTLEAAIPWQALSIKPAPGTEFLFDLAVDDGADGLDRARQLMWNGTDKNSTDRSHWGRAKLLP